MAKQKDPLAAFRDDEAEALYDPAFPHDASFPSNVNPTEANRKRWSDERDADAKGKKVKGHRVGGDEVDAGEG